MPRPLPLAVLVSGTGTTLESLALAVERGDLPARIVAVVADREGVPATAVAARHGLPYQVVAMRGSSSASAPAELDARLRAAGAELVVLAGFQSILPTEFLRGWAGRVVNVHPSLLPRHGGRGQYGRAVYEGILADGDWETGATVHLVTAEVDAGPVLLQDRFVLGPSETVESLQARTQALERPLLAEAIRRFASGEWPLPYDSGASARGSDRPTDRA
jgi:phosphoribosylglycinamide formyltransferase-1